MNIKKAFFFTALISFVVPFTVSAQNATYVIPTRPPVPPVLCGSGIRTPFGCLDLHMSSNTPGRPAITQILRWGASIGGGIAILLIIFAAFQISSATGDPKKLKAAQELLISALTGLLLIVISITLLNFIGFSILNLPGFN